MTTPREKVEQAVRAASRGQWTDGVRVGSAKWCNGLTDAIITALASGSGDHAELARLAEDLRKFEHHAVGSLKIDMDEVRKIIAACDAHAALLAENAALRSDGEIYQNQADHEFLLRKEAERKLAEADQVIREISETAQITRVHHLARTFLSKEATQ